MLPNAAYKAVSRYSTLFHFRIVIIELIDMISQDLHIPDFWKPAHIPDQESLQGRLFEQLYARDLLPSEQLDATVDKLMELARANHQTLVKA